MAILGEGFAHLLAGRQTALDWQVDVWRAGKRLGPKPCFLSSEIELRVFHLVQAGREHCIDWLLEDESRPATTPAHPRQPNSSHP